MGHVTPRNGHRGGATRTPPALHAASGAHAGDRAPKLRRGRRRTCCLPSPRQITALRGSDRATAHPDDRSTIESAPRAAPRGGRGSLARSRESVATGRGRRARRAPQRHDQPAGNTPRIPRSPAAPGRRAACERTGRERTAFARAACERAERERAACEGTNDRNATDSTRGGQRSQTRASSRRRLRTAQPTCATSGARAHGSARTTRPTHHAHRVVPQEMKARLPHSTLTLSLRQRGNLSARTDSH